MNSSLKSLARVLGLAAAVLGTAVPASAAVVVYTSQAAYEAALGTSVASDNFSDLTPDAALAGPLARLAGGSGYRARAVLALPDPGAEDFFPIAPGGNTALSSNFSTASMVFDQFSQSVRGISGQFFSSDEFGSLLAGTLNLVLFDQDGGFNYSLTSGIAPSFLGFISNGSFSGFSLVALQPTDGSFRFAAVDDLGLAARQAVPEPGAASLSLLALGLMLLVAKRRGH
jgi:hypothetical protein